MALLAGCATFQMGNNSPVGTWTNQSGAVWMIKADGTFDADINHDGKRDIWGTYALAGDQMTLQRTGGRKMKGCDGQGVYKFKRAGENLSFTLVSDKCKDRKNHVLMPWHEKK